MTARSNTGFAPSPNDPTDADVAADRAVFESATGRRMWRCKHCSFPFVGAHESVCPLKGISR